MEEHNFVIKHKPGKMHQKPNILSQRPDHEKGENDNVDVTMLKGKWFRTLWSEESTMDEQLIGIPGSSFKEMIQKWLRRKNKW